MEWCFYNKMYQAMLLYTKGKDLEEFLILYDEEYLPEFYNSFDQNYNSMLEEQTDDRYITFSHISIESNFYSTLNMPNV